MDLFDIYPQKFYLFSTKNRRLMEFHSSDHSLEKAIEKAFSSIKCIEGGNIHALYQYEAKTLKIMQSLADQYGDKYKNVLQLPAYFKNFNDGDYFIRHKASAPLIDLKRSVIKIDALTKGLDSRQADNNFVLNWGRLSINFDSYSYGFLTDKIVIGEKDRTQRVCRFCQNRGAEHYKNESHAIMEALGNRLLIANEECDTCNSKFATDVEYHLYKFLEIQRTLCNVSGKGSKNHHLEGLNFQIHPDDITHQPIIYVMSDKVVNALYKGQTTGKTILYNNGQISFQGIYRALNKIAVDLLPSDKKQHFIKTGQWVHGDIDSSALPFFSYGEHTEFFAQPVLDLFFRKANSPTRSPYCTAVLYIFSSVFIYTLPFCDMDNGLSLKDYNDNLSVFQTLEYLPVREWEQFDANDASMKTPFYKISVLENATTYKLEYRPSSDSVFLIKRDK